MPIHVHVATLLFQFSYSFVLCPSHAHFLEQTKCKNSLFWDSWNGKFQKSWLQSRSCSYWGIIHVIAFPDDTYMYTVKILKSLLNEEFLRDFHSTKREASVQTSILMKSGALVSKLISVRFVHQSVRRYPQIHVHVNVFQISCMVFLLNDTTQASR